MVSTVAPVEKKEPLPSTPPQNNSKATAVVHLVTPRVLAPINSGPTQYYANSKAAALMWIVILVQVITIYIIYNL